MKVGEGLKQCVVFICLPKRTIIEGNEDLSFVGTGFLVSKPITDAKDEKSSCMFLVTAKHVASKVTGKTFFIRINDKKGSFRYIQCDTIPWYYHPSEKLVDVALFPINLNKDLYEFKTVSTRSFLTDEIIERKKIGTGDEVVIVGLFAHACGSRRNQPITRMGSVAMMSEEQLPTKTGNLNAYLIEARSIGGLSGSPAFVFETVPIGRGKGYLLGLMHGHWDIAPELKNDLTMPYDSLGKVNMGIAIVIPAKKILEVLNQPKIVEQMEKLKKESSN